MHLCKEEKKPNKNTHGLMITDDGVDDDSEDVSDNNDYGNMECGHYSHNSEL